MKFLPHGVCRNSSKPESTRCSLRVEQLSFLARRISTVGSPGILERSLSLSLSLKTQKWLLHLFLYFFPTFWSQFLSCRRRYYACFVLLSFKTISIIPSMSPSLDFRHLALSRPSISIISLLMPLMAHEYMLYVIFVTSNIVLRHQKRDASKNMQIPTISEFDVLARFRDTIPTVKSVSSSEIQRINFGFLTEITILPFLRKLDFLGSYTN